MLAQQWAPGTDRYEGRARRWDRLGMLQVFLHVKGVRRSFPPLLLLFRELEVNLTVLPRVRKSSLELAALSIRWHYSEPVQIRVLTVGKETIGSAVRCQVE